MVLFITGCGQSAIPVFSVSGEVFYNGEPVDNALIQFVPEQKGSRGAFASTEKGGKFVIATQGASKDGAMPGEYIVLISKILSVDKNGNELPPAVEEPYSPYNTPKQTARPLTKNFLPEKYNDKEKTDLKAKVERKTNHFRFDLRD